MQCLNPILLKTPETRLLSKCLAENKPFEYYYKQAFDRRNLLLDPIPICKSPDEYYSAKFKPRFQKVPCGKCPNCIKRKTNDYFVRNYFEWVNCRVHGSSWLITLTFADELLPKLIDGTPCFDSEIILLFLKRFRRALEKSRLIFGDFSYIIVSEYGGEFGRPHHHALFHFTKFEGTRSNLFVLKEIIAKSWTRLKDRTPWYANQELSLFETQRVDVRLIDSSKGIRYVCKYLGKQFGCDSFDSRRDVPYRYRRNHWQSQGLGMPMYEYISAEEVEKGLVCVDGFNYVLPQYYKLKLQREFYCYNDNGSIIYCPTSFARDSCYRLTMHLLQEYKNLSCINPDFPRCPRSLYDPYNLDLLGNFLSRYGLQGIQDFSSLDECRYEDVKELIDACMSFFSDVDLYYKPKYDAMAKKYIKQQNEFYFKKIGLK